ncbi:MAG TPA: diheme cytochrome c [Anaeromyxobacteraceae bacterium]|nr:diheme cytochrome c [Anaeromyxobacteraceae bacterium]
MNKIHVVIGMVAVVLLGSLAAASDHEHDGHEHRSRHGRRSSAADPNASPTHALYAQECGACHLPFPPGLLPADSHRRIMAALDRHFGQNAELDPPVRDQIERYLVDGAAETGSFSKSHKVMASLDGTVPARITDVPWFQRKHRRIDDRMVSREAIRSRSNCAACHPGADRWDFDDDAVRIPR